MGALAPPIHKGAERHVGDVGENPNRISGFRVENTFGVGTVSCGMWMGGHVEHKGVDVLGWAWQA